MSFEVLKLIVGMLAIVKFTEACNGYHLKLNKVKICQDNNVVIPKNFDMTLDKDCNIIYGGCLEFTKPVKIAKAKYEVSKPPMPTLTGEIDMCNLISNAKLVHLAQMTSGFGLPKKCPVPAKTYCVNGKKKVDITSLKNQLVIAAGTTDIKLNIEHDSGTSCVEISSTISKKK